MKEKFLIGISLILMCLIHGCSNSTVKEGATPPKTKGVSIESDVSTIYFSYLEMAKRFHSVGSLAPNSAKMLIGGDILGDSIVLEDGEDITVDAALAQFKSSRVNEAKKGEIRASAIFYHGVFYDRDYRPAKHESEANSIIALVESPSQSLVFVLPYSVEQGIIYGQLKVFKKDSEVFGE